MTDGQEISSIKECVTSILRKKKESEDADKRRVGIISVKVDFFTFRTGERRIAVGNSPLVQPLPEAAKPTVGVGDSPFARLAAFEPLHGRRIRIAL